MIYLVEIPNKYFDEPLMQSLEVAYLASDLFSYGYDVRIIDGKGIHRNMSLLEIEEELFGEKPPNIAFYTKDVTCDDVLKLINNLKLRFGFTAILIGPRFAFYGIEIIKKHKNIDVIIAGNPIYKLAQVLKGNFSVSGISYRKDGVIIINEIQIENVDMDSYRFPVREIRGINYLTQNKSENESRYIVPMRASCGCSYNCTFCTLPAKSKLINKRWSSRNTGNLMQEIKLLYDKYGSIDIRFLDENFSENVDRVVEIAQLISKIGDIPFSFTARVSTIIKIDDQILKDLYKCGVRGIEIGIENFNNNVLQRYRKGHNCQEAIDAFRKIQNSKIIPAVDFIMFDPWTTIDELKFNLKIIEQEKIDVLTNPIVFNRLYPFVGTPYHDIVDMNQYFQIFEVDIIYQKLKIFESNLAHVRSALSDKKQMLNSLILLKAPYKFLKELVDNPYIDESDSITYKVLNTLCKY